MEHYYKLTPTIIFIDRYYTTCLFYKGFMLRINVKKNNICFFKVKHYLQVGIIGTGDIFCC